LNNYQVINNGCNYPSFLIKTQGDIIFKLYNSRLEIFVE